MYSVCPSLLRGRAQEWRPSTCLATGDRPTLMRSCGHRALIFGRVSDERAELRPPAAAAAATGPVSNAIIRVTRLHRARARQLLREVGLRPGQELILMHLWDAGPQRQTELMRVFDTDSASMTRSVQRLERAGLVQRDADPADRRATRVRSTPAGRELRALIEGLWADLESMTTAGMSQSHQAELLSRLAQAEQNLMAGEPAPR
jgi:DNA-binding MarR family transcriptional regulator